MIACGRVVATRDAWTEIEIPRLALGSAVRIGDTRARVIASEYSRVRVALQRSHDASIAAGSSVREDLFARRVVLGTALLGRAVDAFGEPIDGVGPIAGPVSAPNTQIAPPSHRRAIDEPMWTGVRAIDALLTVGRGARVGIFGAPGAGKSTLIETMVRGTKADAVVVALVGERGREAQEWIARSSSRTTIVCATSDRPAAERVAAASFALDHARALAARGLHVLVILDSLARVAYALRESAGATGEPLGRGGYPASVFTTIAALLERAGRFKRGSVSLIATVLSDGDDRDPVSEGARSLLDGHIVLDASLASAGRYPAIDVPASASRTMAAVASPAHRRAAAIVRAKIARLSETAEARALGIEPPDADEGPVECFLRQGPEPQTPSAVLGMLAEIADTLGESHEYHV